jgi:hypothetical protein
MKTDIKILHSSCCAAGSPIKKMIENVASKINKEIRIEELSDMKDTMIYGTMTFPSIVVNGTVYDFKKYATEDKIESLL